jgi:hypothetical protein
VPRELRAAALIDRLPAAARSPARRLLEPQRRPRLLHDEYIAWLVRVTAGWQHPGNSHLLDVAVRDAPPAPMLEIGCFCGQSAAMITYLQRKHGRRVPLFCCDRWALEGAVEPLPAAAPVTRSDLRAHARESFEGAMRRFSAARLPFAVEAPPQEFLRDWGERRRVTDMFGRSVRLGGPLGFCLIDGERSGSSACSDLAACDRYLLPGGLILLDRSGEGVDSRPRRAARAALASGRYEVVERNPNFLLRKLG